MGTRDEPLKFEIGKRHSPVEAAAFTDAIKARMYARWNETIFGGAFMRDLEAGKLPLETIKLFWLHWYSYPVEINNFHLIIYQRAPGHLRAPPRSARALRRQDQRRVGQPEHPRSHSNFN